MWLLTRSRARLFENHSSGALALRARPCTSERLVPSSVPHYSIDVMDRERRSDMAIRKSRGMQAIAKSRLTIKSQATVPARVRKRLNLKPGDTVIFEETADGAVCIRKAEPLDLEFLSALETTLSEWNSENDDRAYRDL